MADTDEYSWTDRHKLMVIGRNADQAEQRAIEYGSASVGAGIEDDAISGQIDDDVPPDGTDEWRRREEAVERLEGEAAEEITRRCSLMGDAYPFTFTDGRLAYRASVTGVYEFCLATSLAPNVTTKAYAPLAVTFELLATEVARRYLGSSARAIRTGWPSHNLTERPRRFKALSEIVSRESGEWLWGPPHPNSEDPSHQDVKDEGVDLVVWMPMLDNRQGKLFLLGQCACGDGWDGKLDDIKRTKLLRWLKLVTSAPYLTSFFVPHHIAGHFVFQYCNSLAGITFDRARMVLIAEHEINRQAFVASGTGWHLADRTRLVIPSYGVAAAAAA